VTSDVLDIAIQELAGAAEEIDALVAGVPQEPLGGGRLVAAVQVLAQRCSVPATTTVSGTPSAGPEDETTLLYVVSEALTNAAKHADASAIEIDLRGSDSNVSVGVRDNGRGGADASGSGLQGLIDRVASRGGEFRVRSSPAVGTTVFASIPR
jgi:signal transduction histidine kinase